MLLAEEFSNKWWRGLIFSSILCARLKHWGREWPPEGWHALELRAENTESVETVRDEYQEISLAKRPVMEDKVSSPRDLVARLAGAGISFLLGLMVVLFLWQGMQYSNLDLDDHIATLLYLAFFTILAFALLGLVKGPDAIDALLKLIPRRNQRTKMRDDKNNSEREDGEK
jgi:hypothetical protein